MAVAVTASAVRGAAVRESLHGVPRCGIAGCTDVVDPMVRPAVLELPVIVVP
jgi:hypothetical protein